MNLFDRFKLALGFGPDVDPSDPLFADTHLPEVNDIQSPAGIKADSEREVRPVEFEPAMQDAIFEKIVEVFNQSLPEFIGKSIDRDAQIKYLRDSLDEGIKKYLESLNVAAKEYCEQQWKARQNDMAAELEAIKERAEDVEKRSNDIQQKQLSADRQKRALTERVHDLESQLARLESEREQYELENRSLVSRLKVASVYQEDGEKMKAEIQSLKAEITKFKEDPEAVGREREEALNAQIAEMEQGIEALKEQIRIADDIRDNLRGEIKQKDRDIESRDKEIAELNELISEFDAATARMEKAEKQMIDMRNTIESQKAEIKTRDEEIESLKDTISENITRQAEREKMLRDEIEELQNSRLPEMEIGFDDELLEKSHGNAEAPATAEQPSDDEEDYMPMISDEDLTEMSASFDAQASMESPEVQKVAESKGIGTETFEKSIIEETLNFKDNRGTYRKENSNRDDSKKQKNKKRPEQPSLF